ncbi:MAG: exo-alpha-sialidase [Chloroflexi bacterium]|nr:exo-alpha-sialidase [Chloroflexota bacterium]
MPSTRAIAVPDPEGPSFHQVLIAKSTDGLNWETDNRILIDQASVPEVVRFSDGRLGIYAVDGSGQGGPGYVYAESRDGGKTWTCGKMNFAGFGADPDIVWVAENTMRLYSVMFPFGPGQPPSPGQNTKPNSVNSAISTDGKNFSVEEGTRLEGVNYTDPDVIRVGNEWFMYVSTGPTAWAAKSNDGLKFELIGKVNETGAVSGSFVFPDGKIRHYYCANSGIESALSDTGGSVWKKEIGIRIPKAENVKIVCDPSIISDGKSGYWMVYKIQPK